MRSRNVMIWMIVAVLCLASAQVLAVVEFKDGLTHNIDYLIADDVWADYQAPGMQTTVNLSDGGEITYTLQGYEDSRLNILGGSIGDDLYAYGSSQVTMSGGSIGWFLYAYDSSQVTISGGSIKWSLHALGSSQVTMSGGSITDYLWAYDSSQVKISGGSIGWLLIADNDGILTIQGSDFTVDGTPFGYGELTSVRGGSWWNEPHRHLTGILASGELLDNDFYIGDDAKIVLIPEPATLLLLGLGAVILGGKR